MGYISFSECKVSKPSKSDLCGVFSKLIIKAEKKKMSAQNYRMYALLQSTISRLRMDDDLYKLHVLVKRCKSTKNSFEKVSTDGKVAVGNDVEDGDVPDPLQLDTFFDRLKSVNVDPSHPGHSDHS